MKEDGDEVEDEEGEEKGRTITTSTRKDKVAKTNSLT